MRFRSTHIARLGLIALLLAGIAFQPQLIAQAAASLSIMPLTWNVVGLDSNNVNVGPANFPVGARVCNTGDATANNVIVDFVWDDGLNDYNGDLYINLRSGSYSSITVPSLAAGACKDFYFEISVTRSAAAYNMSRDYRITADSDETALVNTPTPREIFVERLVSQNRNSVTDVKLNGVSIAAGGTMNLMVGSTYTIQLVGATATNGYEQIESFINFPNTIFQVNSVAATYSAFPTPHTDPNWASKLYADGCGWVNDPNDIVAPAYRECTGTGKYGGNITITYHVTIIGGGGTSQTLNTLIYDFSGSSYHYNSDFSSSSRIASITTPSACTDANRVPIAGWNFNDQNTIVDTINGMSGVMNTGAGVTTAAYLLRSAGNYAHQSGNWSTVTANQEYLEFVVSTLGFTGIKLSFDAAHDNGNGPDNVDIQYSTNGTNFVTSLTTDPLSTTFAAFSRDFSSITALDDNSSARFRLVGTNASQDSRFLRLDNVTISACPLPRGLTLSKSASPTTYSGPGQAITYTYTLVNTGLAPLRAPFDIADNREPAVTVSCAAATSPLAPGASTTCTGTYTTTAADVTALSVTNTATATGTFNGASVSSNTASATIAYPALNVIKEVSVDNSTWSDTSVTVNAGSPVYYRISVDNTGGENLTGVTVEEDMAACTLSGPSGDSDADNILDPTETWIYTCTVTALAGTQNNTATADSVETGPDTDTASYVGNAPSLNVEKTSTTTAIAAAGQIVPYTFTLTNTGNITLTGITVTDPLCDAAPVYLSGDGNLDNALDLNETWIYSCSRTITQAQLEVGGNLSNTVTADSAESAPDTATLDIPITQTPALTIAKSVAETSFDSVGDVLHYSYLLTNGGNVTLSGPFVVTDDQSTDETCPVTPTLAPGASLTCTASYTVTQADLDAGEVINVASAHGLFAGTPVHSTTDTESVPAVQNPAMAIVKTASPAIFDAVGDAIGYSFVVTNSGNVTLAGPFTVADDKATDELCPATATLAPGASMTCTASYAVTLADLDAGSVTNIAAASASFDGNTITSATDTETVTAVQSPALSIVKTASPATYSTVGTTISYSYAVTNSGNVTLSGPFSVADDKATDEACPATASLGPGASITCTASYVIAQADLDSGSVTNVASASGSFGGNVVTSPTDIETVTAAQSPALAIVKSVTESAYSVVGEFLHYSYLVTNSGNVALDGPFTITDDKSGDETCPATATLVPGGSITCSASYAITQADLDAGSVTNVASAHASFGGNDVNSGTDTRTVNAVQSPAIAIVKSASPLVYSTVGDVISYSYEVRNIGNVTLQAPFTVTDDRVTDEACPATASLAPDASITCTASYTISQADLDTGNVINVASASGSFAGNTITSPTDTETVTATQNPALSITKSVTETSYANVGDVLHYSYLVRNSGNVTLSGSFTVTDDRSLDEACPATATLLPGASITCTATFTVTATDINNGSVTNIASAHGFLAGNAVDSGTDTETVDLAAAPSIVLTKTPALDDAVVAPGGVVNAGDTITYTFSVQNTGNVTVTNIVVTDPLLPTLSCTIASLPFGQSGSCAATNNVYVLTQADIDAGSRANTATATGQDPGGSPVADSDSRSTSLTLVPAIQLTKTGTLNDDDGVPGLSAGDTISYAFTVTNNGNVTLRNVTLADTLGGVTISGGPISSLAPGVSDATTFTGSYALTAGDINSGSFTNTATVTGIAPDGSDATDTDDDVQTLLAQASIVLSKTATVDDTVVLPAGVVNAGDMIRYTFSVENTGNVTVTNINVTDPLLPSLSCTIVSLAPGGVTSCIATGNVYPLTQADIDAGVVVNTATATGFDPGNNSVTDPDTQRTELGQSPRIVLTKTGTLDDTVVPPGGIVNAGDTVTYTFSVENTGNVTVTNINVADPLLPALTCTISSLAPGGSRSCTPTNNVYTLTQADIDAGSRSNTATATGKDPADNDVLDTDNKTTTIAQSPSIKIAKEVSADAANWNDTGVGVTVGDTVYYRVRVSNTGNTTQTGLIVDDGMAACTLTREADLTGNNDNVFEAGEEWAYTCSVTAELGTHNNTATGTTSEAQQASDSASYVASAVQIADPAIAKVGDPAQASVGESVTFTLTVTNEGNAPAPNVVITDALPAIFDVTAVNVSGAPLGTVVNVTPLIGTGPAPYTVVVTLGGDLGVTDVVTIDIVTTVNSLGNPPITNTASLTTTAVNDIVSNNSAALTIAVREAAGGKLPATGFARDRVTRLAPQPLDLAYAATDLLLEIPSLGVKIPIVGVPKKNGTWNVSWLANQAGWLQGSAFPSWNGNSLMTSHVYQSNGLPGPFVNLNKLKYGDRIIVHAYGEKYIFAVQTNTIVEPGDVSALKHEEKPWLTLITCKEYDEKTDTYKKRVVVRAILVSVQ